MHSLGFRDLTPIIIIVGVAEAYTVFNPICSKPALESPANFVGSPDTRGTLDILWSSLFTVFACTWSVQHLTVPEQREGRDQGWWGTIKWKLKGIQHKSVWMIGTVIAPEFIIATAIGWLSDAKRQRKSMANFAAEDGVQWTLTHCMFADMGGFVIRSGTGMVPATQELPLDNKIEGKTVFPVLNTNTAGAEGDLVLADVNKDSTINVRPTIQIRDQAAKIEGDASELVSSVDDKPGRSPNTHTASPDASEAGERPIGSSGSNIYHLNGQQIIALRSQGHIKKLPLITKDEINDKSKGDSFAKTITISQISWMVIQVCVRGARGLAIAQLEIAAVAFALSAILIYALQWPKPKDVGVPITFIQYNGPIPPQVLTSLHKDKLDKSRRGRKTPNSTSFATTHEDARMAVKLGFILGCVIFGAPHIGAWNFKFPTEIEQTIWRATSLYCTCCGIFYFFIIFTYDMFPEHAYYLALSVFHGFLWLYVVARLFILVEIFRTLCFLPASAYVSTWTLNLPYIG